MGFPARRRDRPAETAKSPRAEWYDRNALAATLGLEAAGTAPHALTQRAIYTVPTGKKTVVMHSAVSIMRATAPTTSGRVRGFVYANAIVNAHAMFNSASVGAGENLASGQTSLMLAAAAVRLYTEDLSAGGTVDYYLGVIMNEFDA